jgi:multiple sugar transport system permease protein
MKLGKKWGDPGAIVYLLPAMAPLTVFWLAPMAYIVYLSLTDWDFMSPVKTFVGLDNYAYLFEDPAFRQSLRATLIFALGSVLPAMAGGLMLALLLHGNVNGSGLYRAVLFSPWVTPAVAVSIVWSWIFEPRAGLANALLEAVRLEGLPWLESRTWAMVAILIVTVWKGVGWTMVFYLAALRNVPAVLLEAAAIDGAGKIRSFRHVTLPLLSPTTFFLFIVLVIDSMQAYDHIHVLTQGGPSGATRTLLYLYYQAAFERFNVGEASAVAVTLVAITAALSVCSFRLSRGKVHHLS